MEAHLQTLGVAPLAIEAQLKSESDDMTRAVIALDYKRFLIYKKSKITTLAEAYNLDIDRSFPCQSGTRQTVVRLKDRGSLASIIVTSSMPTTAGGLQQTDTWKLQENGLIVIQEIRATNLQNCHSCMTVRVWNRVPTSSEDVNALTTLLQEEKGSVVSP
eukprot:439137_1